MKPRIFIDGSEGTTGLQIHERLAGRTDIEVLQIEPSRRKDVSVRKRLINSADLVFICLPDEAAREAVALVENDKTRVIDASSAHRTTPGWMYGLPELCIENRIYIEEARFVSNPGCHATGAILFLEPLIFEGLLPDDYPVTITSVTGYTGGGKKMIAEYEEQSREEQSELDSPRAYSLTKEHKHVREIMLHTGLKTTPAFIPIVADYPQGLQVIIPLHRLPGKRRVMFNVLKEVYAGCKNVDVFDDSPAFSASNVNANSDKVTLRVLGSGDIVILTAQLDNLGKGASGAAVQNMNIMLGFDEYEGLIL